MKEILIYLFGVWTGALATLIVLCLFRGGRSKKRRDECHYDPDFERAIRHYGRPWIMPERIPPPLYHHRLTHADMVQMETEHKNKEAEEQ